MLDRLLNEPALLVGLVRAGIILLVTFGVQVTAEQQDALLGFLGIFLAVVSLALTGVTRSLVTPSKNVLTTTADVPAEGNG